MGYFVLTMELLPLILKYKTRVVNVASVASETAPKFDPKDYPPTRKIYETNYMDVYKMTKLSNVMFTHELQKRYGNDGVLAVSLHPGCIATSIGRNTSIDIFGFSTWLFSFFGTRDV